MVDINHHQSLLWFMYLNHHGLCIYTMNDIWFMVDITIVCMGATNQLTAGRHHPVTSLRVPKHPTGLSPIAKVPAGTWQSGAGSGGRVTWNYLVEGNGKIGETFREGLLYFKFIEKCQSLWHGIHVVLYKPLASTTLQSLWVLVSGGVLLWEGERRGIKDIQSPELA